jgi:flagellar biosynthesis component FlhA
MADTVATQSFLPALTARLRQYAPGSDVGLALGVILLLSVLVLPLPTLLLDLGLALSITSAVLVLMVALFLNRPLDFTSFPTLLLLTTLLRLSLNVAVTRLILSHGNEGPLAAGHVVAAFGGFLMGGDVVIGLIIFSNHILVARPTCYAMIGVTGAFRCHLMTDSFRELATGACQVRSSFQGKGWNDHLQGAWTG